MTTRLEEKRQLVKEILSMLHEIKQCLDIPLTQIDDFDDIHCDKVIQGFFEKLKR